MKTIISSKLIPDDTLSRDACLMVSVRMIIKRFVTWLCIVKISSKLPYPNGESHTIGADKEDE